MGFLRTVLSYALSVAATYVFATAFYTQQVIAALATVGGAYSLPQKLETFFANLAGLSIYGIIITIALLIGLCAAWLIKKVLKPLAPIAYPVAGACAIYTAITLIETQLGGGAGIIGGARTPVGVALQAAAGFIGGIVFAVLRPINAK